MNNALAQTNDAVVDTSVYGNYTAGELDVIRSTIARDCNDAQFALFMRTAAGWGLNPFLNHIHAIVYKEKMSIQVAYDGYLYKAKQHPEFLGVDAQLIHENDTFEAEMTDINGVQSMRIKTHKIGFPRGKLIGGYAIARRKGFPDTVVLMEVDEVEHYGNKNPLWNTNKPDMFKKHMSKRAIKSLFGIDINEDEPLEPKMIDVTPTYEQPRQVIAQGGTNGSNLASATFIQTGENKTQTQDEILAEKRTEVKGKLRNALMSPGDLEEYTQEKFQKSFVELDARELVALSRFLDSEIEAIRKADMEGQQELELPL